MRSLAPDGLPLRKGCNHLIERRVVTKGFADVSEVIDIPRPEDEGPSQLEGVVQLEGVLAKFVLTVTGGLGPLARSKIVSAQ